MKDENNLSYFKKNNVTFEKVRQLRNSNGNKVANQFVIETDKGTFFQSYGTIIAGFTNDGLVFDRDYWNYSRTTSRHRNTFTHLDTAETKKRIKDGQIIMESLNPDNHYAGYGY